MHKYFRRVKHMNGVAEGCVMINMFHACLTIACNCKAKRLLSQDSEVMAIFEKYIHPHSLPVSMLYASRFQVILYIPVLI